MHIRNQESPLTLASAILKRSYATSQLTEDTHGCIPDHLFNKVKAYNGKSTEIVSEQRSIRSNLHSDDSRKPTIALNATSALPQRPQNQRKTGLCIPGALSIDPRVRNAAAKEGLTPSENAIWLLVVAAREYATTMLKSCTEIKRSAMMGKHARVPLPRPHTLSYKPKPGEVTRRVNPPPKANPAPRVPAPSGPLRITAFDIHTLVTQLPMGAAASLAGTVSRESFETTLFHGIDVASSLDGGDRFGSLRRFIVSGINARAAQAASDTSRKTATARELQEDRKSPHGGLGRGAKDLASLRARSSVTPKSEGENTSEISAAGSQQAPAPTDMQHESYAQSAARRGKGSGVKNLRAMLARNRPLTPGESAESQTTESSAQNTANGN